MVAQLSPLSILSDADLTRMTANAWREAARSWQEARRATGLTRTLLLTAAESADAYWRDLRDEQDGRLEEVAASTAVEDRSSDVYTLLPGDEPEPPVFHRDFLPFGYPPVTAPVERIAADVIHRSPFTRAAFAGDLPCKATR